MSIIMSIDDGKVFAVLQSSTVFVAVSRGFGETIEDVSSASLIQMEMVSHKALDIEEPARTYWSRHHMRATYSTSLLYG